MVACENQEAELILIRVIPINFSQHILKVLVISNLKDDRNIAFIRR